MPHARAGRSCRRRAREGAAAVYLPACINRIFGRARGAARRGPSLAEALVAVSARAGLPVWIPPDVAGHCCATPWSSKGYAGGPRRDGEPDRRRAVALERRRASCRSSSTRARARSGSASEVARRCSSEATRERHAQARDPRLGRLGARRLLPRAGGRAASSARSPSTRPARRATSGSTRRSRAIAAALADEVVDPARRDLLRLRRRPRHAAPRADGGGTADEAAELAGRGFDAHMCSQPHLRDRPPAGDRPRLRVVRLRARGADPRLTGVGSEPAAVTRGRWCPAATCGSSRTDHVRAGVARELGRVLRRREVVARLAAATVM